MSTVAFAQLTARRQKDDPDAPEAARKAPTGKYADIVAALIPAEVIAAHAVIVSQATEVKKADVTPDAAADPAGTKLEQVTDILDPTALKVAFWGLLVASILLYVFTKLRSGAPWGRLDYVRAAVPGLAFVTWTMLTEPSAFDGFDPGDLSDTTQVAIGVVAAVILGGVAKVSQDSADAEEPPGDQADQQQQQQQQQQQEQQP